MAESDVHDVGDGSPPPDSLASVGQVVGHLRFVVMVPVASVLLVALSLFLLGAIQALAEVWWAWSGLALGHVDSPGLSVAFLKTVTIMLEAVVFFLIGVGMYSLFVAPLNLAVALGVETFNDLEERVISLVVAILAVTFLEHFIQWEQPRETLQYGGALAVTVGTLVLFLIYSHRAKVEQKAHKPGTLARSKREMFQRGEEHHDIQPDDEAHDLPGTDRETPS